MVNYIAYKNMDLTWYPIINEQTTKIFRSHHKELFLGSHHWPYRIR